MAITKRVYGWVSKGEFKFPLPSKLKTGSPSEIINQMKAHSYLYYYDETKGVTCKNWQNTHVGSAFKQELKKDGTIIIKPITIQELLVAAEHPLANVDVQELKYIAEETEKKLSEFYKVGYCGYYVNCKYTNWKYVHLNYKRHYLNPCGDRVCVFLKEEHIDENIVRNNIQVPEGFLLNIHNVKKGDKFCVTDNFVKDVEGGVVELYRHKHFYSWNYCDEIDIEYLTDLVEIHNNNKLTKPKEKINVNQNLLEYFILGEKQG